MDQDSDHSYEEPDDAVPSPPRSKREGNVRETTEASLSSRSSDESSREEGDYTEDDAPSAGESQDQRSLLKRSADNTVTHRPFKRRRADLNYGYLELLNSEIEDAAHRSSFGDLADLPPSQIGLTYWSALEKRILFEAVARLGKHDLPGIATTIGSKSIAEVSHYLNFLQDAHNLRRKLETRSFLEPAEYPAAVELSQQCCHAQEEAADEVSLKQEAREVQREQSRWGEVWDVTPKVARKLGQDVQDANSAQQPPFAQLFRLSKWLELSGRMFMNSSIPGNNWRFVEDEPPSVWATTFEDFHSLAVSITRRLVQTTLFMAMSRIRSKDAGGGRIRDMVLVQDAEAAIASLGMVANLNDTWIKSARRLRLDVYEDPLEDMDENDEEPMTYDEVERCLSGEQVSDSPSPLPESPFPTQQPCAEDEEYSQVEDSSDDSRSPSPLDEEEQEIKTEADEVFVYSAADTRHDKHARETLKARIEMERQKEQHADECDEYASYKAETEMWDVLQKKPPMELPKRQEPGPPKRSNLDVESVYPGGRDWIRKLQYYSEWETLPDQQGQDDTDE